MFFAPWWGMSYLMERVVSHLRFHVHVNKESSETIIVANISNRGGKGSQRGFMKFPWEISKMGGGLEEEENKENSQHEM